MIRPGVAAAVAAAAMLFACGRAELTVTPRDAATPQRISARVSAPAPVRDLPAAPPAPQAAPWPPVQMQDPDPRMRRFALERWAREPTESLDLVGAALVDPEESIRERAEQVLEEVLARRR